MNSTEIYELEMGERNTKKACSWSIKPKIMMASAGLVTLGLLIGLVYAIQSSKSEVRDLQQKANHLETVNQLLQDQIDISTSTERPVCSLSCKSNEFTCSSGLCIPLQWKCDGQNDCDDSSDEGEACPEKTCDDGEFKCSKTGNCIPHYKVCDGKDDCGDLTDEGPPFCGAGCPGVEFKPNNRVIPTDKLFNGVSIYNIPWDICRFNHSSSHEIIIGIRTRAANDRDCFGSYKSSEQFAYHNYEVLLNNGGANLKWVQKSTVSNMKKALAAGTSSSGERLYVGRCKGGENHLIPGRLQGGKLFYAQYGKVFECNKEFEILVCD